MHFLCHCHLQFACRLAHSKYSTADHHQHLIEIATFSTLIILHLVRTIYNCWLDINFDFLRIHTCVDKNLYHSNHTTRHQVKESSIRKDKNEKELLIFGIYSLSMPSFIEHVRGKLHSKEELSAFSRFSSLFFGQNSRVLCGCLEVPTLNWISFDRPMQAATSQQRKRMKKLLCSLKTLWCRVVFLQLHLHARKSNGEKQE